MKFIDPRKVEREKELAKRLEEEKSKERSKLLSLRQKLLQKIREKEQKKKDKREEEDNLTDEEKEEKESLRNSTETNSQRLEREKEEKLQLSKKAELKKMQTEDTKKRSSARDNVTQEIKELEERISKTKYNKSTQKGIGLMKAQLATLKQKLTVNSKAGGASGGYSVKKSGDATVVLLGFPSTGKSTLLNSLTNANSEVAAYAFTTLTCIPGMLNYKQTKIQILDVPGIVEGAAAGTGRGKEVLQVIRTADLILMVIDALKPVQKSLLEKEVYDTNIRLNQKKPDIKIRKTLKNGVRIGRTVLTEIDDETIQSIMTQFKIMNAEVLLRDNIDTDQLIDAIEGNRVFTPAITVVNKEDLITAEQKNEIIKTIKPDLFISAQKKEHLDQLKELIYEKLGFIRVYLKEVNKKADMNEPMIMRSGATLKDLCEKLHRDFVEKFKFARIWGPSAKFDEQKMLNLDHQIKDTDIIEIHLK